MSPSGDYLGGSFGIVQKEEARDLMTAALEKRKTTGAFMRSVPTNALAIYGGKKPQPGSLKLQLAYRDLPRGDVERPNTAYIQNPYNLGWLDISKVEAQTFLTESEKPIEIPQRLFAKIATQTLKDAVRGQMSRWNSSALRSGSLTSQRISKDESRSSYRLQGTADLAEEERSYKAQLHGQAVYDSSTQAFVEFELVAVGQRTGKGGANGRENDLGPAPMGVAFKLYQAPDTSR